MRDQFIVLEGGEGAGKSTIARHLASTIPNSVLTREPGGTPFAEKLRALLLEEKNEGARFPLEAEFSLFWAARFDHIEKVINPALRAGKTVVCDRFDVSTYAYQVCAQRRQQDLLPLFLKLREYMIHMLIQKPLYLYFDVDPKIGLERVKLRGGATSYFDDKKLAFHESLRQGFQMFPSLYSNRYEPYRPLFIEIDASRSAHDVLAETTNVLGL